MQMVARIRTVVEVPFDYDVQPPDETGESPSRGEATDYAVNTILPNVLQNAGQVGTVVTDDCILEEVREADEADMP
jgi:hypothetical protein